MSTTNQYEVNGVLVTETINNGGFTTTQYTGNDGVTVVEGCIIPSDDILGPAPERINEAQPFNGKQNNLENGLVEEIEDKKIYDDVEHNPTSFALDVTTLKLQIGDSHVFTATPTPITANIPSLVWECTKGTAKQATGKKDADGKDITVDVEIDVVTVVNGVLHTINPGKCKVIAYDMTPAISSLDKKYVAPGKVEVDVEVVESLVS